MGDLNQDETSRHELAGNPLHGLEIGASLRCDVLQVNRRLF